MVKNFQVGLGLPKDILSTGQKKPQGGVQQKTEMDTKKVNGAYVMMMVTYK